MQESDVICSKLLPEVVVSDPGSESVELVAGPSSSSLNIDEDNEVEGSSSTRPLKRKRSGSDIVDQDGSYATTLGVFLFLLSNVPFVLTWRIQCLVDSDISDFSQPLSSSSSRKGKGKAKELDLQSPDIPETITIPDTPDKETSDEKWKTKLIDVEPRPKKPKDELLGGYSCPICFSPPSNATLTPCGHICCGLCLFVAVKTTMQRATTMAAPEGAIPR